MQASCVSFKNFQHDPAYSHDYRSLLLGILSFLLRVLLGHLSARKICPFSSIYLFG